MQKTEKICKYLLHPGPDQFQIPMAKYVPGKYMLLYKYSKDSERMYFYVDIGKDLAKGTYLVIILVLMNEYEHGIE